MEFQNEQRLPSCRKSMLQEINDAYATVVQSRRLPHDHMHMHDQMWAMRSYGNRSLSADCEIEAQAVWTTLTDAFKRHHECLRALGVGLTTGDEEAQYLRNVQDFLEHFMSYLLVHDQYPSTDASSSAAVIAIGPGARVPDAYAEPKITTPKSPGPVRDHDVDACTRARVPAAAASSVDIVKCTAAALAAAVFTTRSRMRRAGGVELEVQVGSELEHKLTDTQPHAHASQSLAMASGLQLLPGDSTATLQLPSSVPSSIAVPSSSAPSPLSSPLQLSLPSGGAATIASSSGRASSTSSAVADAYGNCAIMSAANANVNPIEFSKPATTADRDRDNELDDAYGACACAGATAAGLALAIGTGDRGTTVTTRNSMLTATEMDEVARWCIRRSRVETSMAGTGYTQVLASSQVGPVPLPPVHVWPMPASAAAADEETPSVPLSTCTTSPVQAQHRYLQSSLQLPPVSRHVIAIDPRLNSPPEATAAASAPFSSSLPFRIPIPACADGLLRTDAADTAAAAAGGAPEFESSLSPRPSASVPSPLCLPPRMATAIAVHAAAAGSLFASPIASRSCAALSRNPSACSGEQPQVGGTAHAISGEVDLCSNLQIVTWPPQPQPPLAPLALYRNLCGEHSLAMSSVTECPNPRMLNMHYRNGGVQLMGARDDMTSSSSSVPPAAAAAYHMYAQMLQQCEQTHYAQMHALPLGLVSPPTCSCSQWRLQPPSPYVFTSSDAELLLNSASLTANVSSVQTAENAVPGLALQRDSTWPLRSSSRSSHPTPTRSTVPGAGLLCSSSQIQFGIGGSQQLEAIPSNLSNSAAAAARTLLLQPMSCRASSACAALPRPSFFANSNSAAISTTGTMSASMHAAHLAQAGPLEERTSVSISAAQDLTLSGANGALMGMARMDSRDVHVALVGRDPSRLGRSHDHDQVHPCMPGALHAMQCALPVDVATQPSHWQANLERNDGLTVYGTGKRRKIAGVDASAAAAAVSPAFCTRYN